jgi:hypothetical protein
MWKENKFHIYLIREEVSIIYDYEHADGFINLQIGVIIHGRNSGIKFAVITEVLQTRPVTIKTCLLGCDNM